MITGKQLDILQALARYGCLTVRQFQRLGIYNDKARLSGALSQLGRLKLIAGTETQNASGAVRFPRVYTLTAAGAVKIGVPAESILKPLRAARPGAPLLDLAYRTAIVDCHIGLSLWAAEAGHAVEHFIPDFAPHTDAGRRAMATYIEHGAYAPDAVALLACADGVKRPLVLEIYRGGMTDRPGYMLSKLPEVLRMLRPDGVRNAMTALTTGEIAAPRLLIITATDTLRDALLDRPPAPELPGWQASYLKTLTEIEFDFAGEWWRVPRRREPLLPRRAGAADEALAVA